VKLKFKNFNADFFLPGVGGGWWIERALAEIEREDLGPRREVCDWTEKGRGRAEQHNSTTSSFYVENSDIGTRSKQTSVRCRHLFVVEKEKEKDKGTNQKTRKQVRIGISQLPGGGASQQLETRLRVSQCFCGKNDRGGGGKT